MYRLAVHLELTPGVMGRIGPEDRCPPYMRPLAGRLGGEARRLLRELPHPRGGRTRQRRGHQRGALAQMIGSKKSKVEHYLTYTTYVCSLTDDYDVYSMIIKLQK